MSSPPDPWFAVLPDCDIHPDVLRRLRRCAPADAFRVVAHRSGRPWLVGAWSPGEVTVASAGEVRLAVAGTCSLTAGELAAAAGRMSGLAQVETALAGACGSFHVIASADGHAYARGSSSGARRIYRAAVEGGTVCADRARVLARLTGAALDPGQLAVRLLGPTAPYPLAGGALWRGVHAVLPGDAAHLAPDGRWRTERWWRAPEEGLPPAEAAVGLRQALRAAVALRVTPGEVVAADLSGGMDSTAVCFLAAEAGARLVTATLHWAAAGNQDRAYAAHAAEHLPGAEQLVFPSALLPAHFTGLDERRPPADEPSVGLRGAAQQRCVAEALRSRGARLRLSGHGGDHVVRPPDAYVHRLVRRSPVTGLRHVAGLRARHRWPPGATVRMLLAGGSYGFWLADSAGRLREEPPGGAVRPPEGWGPPPRLPAWASGQAAGLVGELLRAAARDGPPPAGGRGRHAWIHRAQEAGRSAGHLLAGGAAAGLPVHSPFCDDAVVDACLRARPHEAAAPWAYKPLLAAAMDGLVPARVLRRTTKDHCGDEWQEGLRRHRRTLAAWADDSRLVAAGLADEEPLRRALLSPGLLTGGAAELEATLGAEAWLRDLAAHPADEGGPR
ncbi:asparagine synthase-related protein [Streptomyces caatingaensis]|uniref:asparagine synthase-related protein n=1 Tax=Streptomyces caatingaensis TaxID=1678637 RepID=UPI000A72583B|nr:asparagine synthase-related protein [Streptomyces caatingaensis]